MRLYMTILAWPICNAIAMPQPAHDGSGLEKPPLPGRTDFSIDDNGLITGYVGDDKLPKHMVHVQDTIAEFPRNGHAYPYDSQGELTRKQRLKHLPAAQPELGSKEPQALDEKTWALQRNPNWVTDTTVRPVPHYESGGRKAKVPEIVQEWRDKQIAMHPEWKGIWPPSKPLPEGAYKNEGGLTSSIKSAVSDYENMNPGKKAKIKIAPNPGWLPFSSAQLRAHEAPAAMMQSPYTKGKSGGQPIVNQKPKPENKPKNKIALASGPEQADNPGSDAQASSGSRREGLRQRKPREPELPRPNPPKPGSARIGDDPSGYLRIAPTVPHYIPGIDQPSKTPEIGPWSDKATMARIPPRPQNRESGLQKPRPGTTTLPPLNPIEGGRTGKEGTSYEAPEGKSTHPTIDVSTWKAYGSAGQSSSKGKEKQTTTEQDLVSGLQGLSIQTKPKGKENQEPSNIPSPVSSRLRSDKKSTAVIAAQRAMAGSSKGSPQKSSKKNKRDLLVYLLRRELEKSLEDHLRIV